MTTTDSSITQDLTPVEAANLLENLEEGHQAAWLSTHQVPWHSAEYQARFQNAAEVDDVFRDLMWETLENGMRRPGEPVEEFAERAESEARLAEARKASAEPPADMISKHAGIIRERLPESQDELAGRLRNDASTPEDRAYARAFSATRRDPREGAAGARSAARARPHAGCSSPGSVPRQPRLARQQARHLHPPCRAGVASAAGARAGGRVMTTGIECRADPRCEQPAPPETGICHCHAKQATKAPPTIHRLSRAEQVRRAWSREPEKELEP